MKTPNREGTERVEGPLSRPGRPRTSRTVLGGVEPSKHATGRHRGLWMFAEVSSSKA